MDPILFGLVALVGAGVGAAMQLRRGRDKGKDAAPPKPLPAVTEDGEPLKLTVGTVLTFLEQEFWLAGELTLKREGAVVLRLFHAPEKGRDRWVVASRDDRSLWVLDADSKLEALGWPGVEVPSGDGVLRRHEWGNAALLSAGELPQGWEGMGRFAVFRGVNSVALVVEGPQGARLALVGREVPRALVQRLG